MSDNLEQVHFQRYQEVTKNDPNAKSWLDLSKEEKDEFSKVSEQEARCATGARLRSYIERIERLEEEKKGIMDDIKEVRGEAKSDGFDVKIISAIIKLRKMDDADRAESEALMETYLSAIGM